MRKLRQGLAMVLSVLLVLVSVGCGSNAENKVEWGRADAKEIDVNSKIAGRVVELLVKEGDEVRARAGAGERHRGARAGGCERAASTGRAWPA